MPERAPKMIDNAEAARLANVSPWTMWRLAYLPGEGGSCRAERQMAA
jgi:hypothetical protein